MRLLPSPKQYKLWFFVNGIIMWGFMIFMFINFFRFSVQQFTLTFGIFLVYWFIVISISKRVKTNVDRLLTEPVLTCPEDGETFWEKIEFRNHIVMKHSIRLDNQIYWLEYGYKIGS